MRLRVARRGDAELKVLLCVEDQIGGMGEAPLNRNEATLVLGGVAAQRDQVFDARVFESSQDGVYGLFRLGRAGDVSHHVQACLASGPHRHLHRQRLGGATRSICDVDEVWAVLCEGLDSIEYGLHRGFISRGEVLEREGALRVQDVSYLHWRFQTVVRDGGRQHLGGDGQAGRTPKV